MDAALHTFGGQRRAHRGKLVFRPKSGLAERLAQCPAEGLDIPEIFLPDNYGFLNHIDL
jgi:hypothetical protein